MTDPNYTHLAFLLDRSGSMQAIKQDTEGGFDAFIRSQAEQAGRCTVTLAQFDTDYEVVYSGIDIAEVAPLDLRPRGTTALLDSIGRLVQETGAWLAALPEESRPGTVLVGIMTDGLENASREWTRPAVKALIESQERDYAWTFSYLGANQDAVEVGASMGVDPSRAMTYAGEHVGAAMDAYAMSTNRLRRTMAAGQDVQAARAAAALTDEERRRAVGRG